MRVIFRQALLISPIVTTRTLLANFVAKILYKRGRLVSEIVSNNYIASESVALSNNINVNKPKIYISL